MEKIRFASRSLSMLLLILPTVILEFYLPFRYIHSVFHVSMYFLFALIVILKFGSCYESSSEATCTEIIDRRDDLAAFPNAVIESCVMADCVEDFCNVHDDLLKSATEAATTAAGRFARLGTLSWITPEMPTTTPVLTTAGNV